ncbi:pilus assembly PilX N-terminal domain-containing protein [Dongshaea marina]|uniref:pilus assembly PilX N-terminal domain-containing protein n=1 Tax=Dongshaea marina TaxID=2047966 RepID=UPI000D3E58CA|nr:pilus assembly PilX N-terminal domain-containing protein [Dongshaea marina]
MRKLSGFTTLTITLIMVLFITTITLVTGKVMVTDRRIVANEIRYQQALVAAQAGINDAIARLSRDINWRESFPLTLTGSQASGASYNVAAVNEAPIAIADDLMPLVTFTSTGSSADGLARSTVHEQVTVSFSIAAIPDAPLMVAGGVDVGSLTVATNPNGGGPGVALSIWSDALVDLSNGSGHTCNQEEFYYGYCSSQSISEFDNKQADILDNDPNFPANLIAYLFGIDSDASGMAELEYRADSISNCALLTLASSGFYIVDGVCNLSGQVGTQKYPVTLLVRNGDLVMNSDLKFYGLLFSYDSVPSGGVAYEIEMIDGAMIYGALISNHELESADGEYTVVYDEATLNNIKTGQAFSLVNRVPGSWRDF